jgi:hypothetical protein
MSLADIVDVQITATTATADRAGFGVPLIAAHHTQYADRVRTYTNLQGLVDDGFVTTSPTYLLAAALLSQNPRPKTFKVGRRALAPAHAYELTVTDATQGRVYTVTINGVAVTYTVGAAETPTTVATALELLIDAAGAWSSTSATSVITVSNVGGAALTFSGLNAELKLRETTADPGIATDLTAINAADADWYALLIDSNGEAEILAAAAWIEAQEKIFIASTADTLVTDAGTTTDVASDLETAAYARTALLYSVFPQAAAAWAGKLLPTDPGSETWAFKTLATVPYSSLTASQVTALDNKSANHYTRIAGNNLVRKGKVSAGEYIDVVRFRDWLKARIQERILNVLMNAAKLPYTDAGVDVVRSEIYAQLRQGIAVGGLAADPEPTVTAPKVADIDPADRANRLLPDVEFSATLAGAIHALEIRGTLSV